MWKQWVNAILGAAIAVIAFFGVGDATLTWILALMGTGIVALSLWTAREVPKDEYDRAVHAHERHRHA